MNRYFCNKCKRFFEAKYAKGCLYCFSKDIELHDTDIEVIVPENGSGQDGE